MDNFPVLDFVPDPPREPVLLSCPADKRWAFSFRYWQQRQYFGLDASQPSWFVSLLEKLRDLSGKKIETFISDQTEQSAWRYHKIDWNQKNIPIQRSELDWVDAAYRENEEDYPLLQFQVSQALGRVVGFWDETSIFNIVLLDPLHNIQPSKRYGYRIDPCNPLSCDYTALLFELNGIKSSAACAGECEFRAKLEGIPTNTAYSNVVMHFLNDTQKAEIDLVLTDDSTYTDLLLLAAQQLK